MNTTKNTHRIHLFTLGWYFCYHRLFLKNLWVLGFVFWGCSDNNNSSNENTNQVISEETISEETKQQPLFVSKKEPILANDSNYQRGDSRKARLPFSPKKHTIEDKSNTDEYLKPTKRNINNIEDLLPDTIHIPKGNFKECRDSTIVSSMQIRTIHIDQPFLIMNTEVTNTLWKAMVNDNRKTFFNCVDCPKENVSWFDAVDFSNLLNTVLGLPKCYHREGARVSWSQGLSCTGWRLPTDTEWSYAAQYMTTETTLYVGGDDVDKVAWTLRNSDRKPSPVATLQPTSAGLYDMSGNVWEWVWNQRVWPMQHNSSIEASNGFDDRRIRRGGSWSSGENNAEMCSRGYFNAAIRNPSIGFRLVRSLVESD